MHRPLIVLDLDETLIHATLEPLSRAWDFRCEPYFVYRRPGLSDFLAKLRTDFEVGVWTSSTEDYASCIVRQIFPDGYPLAFVWSRERCTLRFDPELQDKYWMKNVQKLKRRGYSLQRVVCIDDTYRKYHRSYGNVVLVPEYTGEPEDQTLQRLLDYLLTLREVPDVRRVDKRRSFR
jgi:RNA polymerase II subunit A small phosphatase-like protein